MKKKVEVTVQQERSFCNICEQEITSDPYTKTRIAIVRGLFKTEDFDAHEKCINTVIRQAFEKYFPQKS